MLSKEKIANQYNQKAERYDRSMRLSGILGLDRIRQEIFKRARGRVLEIGGGTGKNLPYYPKNIELTVTDLSSSMLDVAKERANSYNMKVSFEVMDAEKLTYPDQDFDTVASSLSLCTISYPIIALNEMRRVCKKDGKILLFEHGKSSWHLIARLQDYYTRCYEQKNGCHWNRDPQKLCQDVGLNKFTIKRMFFGILYLIEADNSG